MDLKNLRGLIAWGDAITVSRNSYGLVVSRGDTSRVYNGYTEAEAIERFKQTEKEGENDETYKYS